MKRTASSALTLAIASVATVAFGQNAGEALVVPGAWEDGAAVPSLTSIRLETIRSRDETLLRDLAGALVARYGTLLEGTEILFTRVETFGTVFYRLDIQNIGSEEDARRICAVLEMERCLVARPGASQLVTGEAFVIAPDGLIDMHASAQVLGEGVSNSVEFSPLPTMPQGVGQDWEEAEPLRDALGVLPLDRPSRAQAALGGEAPRNAFLPQSAPPADGLSDSLDAALALARSEPREATPELVLQKPEAQPQRPRPSLAPTTPPAVSVSVPDGAGGTVPLVRGVEDPKAVEGLIAQVARPRLAPRMRPDQEAVPVPVPPVPAPPMRSAPLRLPDVDRLTRLPELRPDMDAPVFESAPGAPEDQAAAGAPDVAVQGVRPRMRPDRSAPDVAAQDGVPGGDRGQDVAGVADGDGAPPAAAKPLPVWKAGPRQPQEIVPAERLVSRAPRHVAPVVGEMAAPSPRDVAMPARADSLRADLVAERQLVGAPPQEAAPFAPAQAADIADLRGVSSPAPMPVRSSADMHAPARLAHEGGPLRPRLRPARGGEEPQAFVQVAGSVAAADAAAQASAPSAPVALTPATALASDVDRAAPAAVRVASAPNEGPIRAAGVQDLAQEAEASFSASRADQAPYEGARMARADMARGARPQQIMAFEEARVARAVLAGIYAPNPHVDGAVRPHAQAAGFVRGLRLAQAFGRDGHVQRTSVARAPGVAGAPAMAAGFEAADVALNAWQDTPLARVAAASVSADPSQAPVWLASARGRLAAGAWVAPLDAGQEEALRVAMAGPALGVGRAALARGVSADALMAPHAVVPLRVVQAQTGVRSDAADLIRADAVLADAQEAELADAQPAALAPATGAQDAPLRVAFQARTGHEHGAVAPDRAAVSAPVEQAREGVARRARFARAQRGDVALGRDRAQDTRTAGVAPAGAVSADVAARPKAAGSPAPRLAASAPGEGAGMVRVAVAARVDVAGHARLSGARGSVGADVFVAQSVGSLADAEPLRLTPAMRRAAVAPVGDTAIVRAWQTPVQVAQAARTPAPQPRLEQGQSARGWIGARAAQVRGVRAPQALVGPAPVAPSTPADPTQAARLVLTADMRAPHVSPTPAVAAKGVEKHVLAETKILKDSGSVLPISPAPATVSGAQVIAAHARPVETETEKMLFESALMAAIAPTAAPVATQEVAARIEVASARPDRDMAVLAKTLDRARPAQESVALVGVDAPIGMEALLDSAEMTVRLISGGESAPAASPVGPEVEKEPIEIAALMPARTQMRAGVGAVRDRVRLDAIPGPQSGRPIDAFLSVWDEPMPLATSELALATAMPREWGATQAVYRGPATEEEEAQPAMWTANPPAAAFHALGQTLDEVQTMEGYIEALTKPGTIFAAPQVPSFAQVAQARAQSTAARAVLDSALAERGEQEAGEEGLRMALPQVRPDPKSLQGEEGASLPQTIRATVGADAITMETQDLRVLAPRAPKPSSRFAVVFSDTYALPFDLSGTGRPPLQRLPLVRPRVAAQGEAAEPTARMIAASEDMAQFFPTEASNFGQDGQPRDQAVDMIDELRGGLDETLGALEIAMDSLPPAAEVVQEAQGPVEARPALSLPPLDATVRPLAAAPLVPAEGEVAVVPAAPVVAVAPQDPQVAPVAAPAGAPTVADLLDAPAGTPAPELGPQPSDPVPFAEGTPNWPSVGSASILDRDTRRMAPASPNDALMIRLSYAASPDEVTVRVRDLMRNFPQSMLEKGRFYGAAAPASPGLFIVGIQAHNAIDREDLVAYMTNNGIPFVLPGQSAAPLLSQQ